MWGKRVNVHFMQVFVNAQPQCIWTDKVIGGMGHSKREDTGRDGTAENKVGSAHGLFMVEFGYYFCSRRQHT